MKKYLILGLVLLILLATAGCRSTAQPPPAREEVPPTDIAEETNGEEEIELTASPSVLERYAVAPRTASPSDLAMYENGEEEEGDENDEPEAYGILGAWVHVRSAEGDDETPLSVDDFGDAAPRIEIRAGYRFEGYFWGVNIEGILVATETNLYTLTEQRASEGGDEWEPEDGFLRYDPASGLLRYTFYAPATGVDVHHFFERAQ
jgi:hypothetical protein